MKKTIAVFAASAALFASAAQPLAMDDAMRQAVQGAMDEVQAALAASQVSASEPAAVLPVVGDADGWLAGQLKIALTKAGKTCVEGKEDPMWDEILKEIEWNARKEDILDAATLDKFGKLKSAKVLVSAFVRGARRTERIAFFEVELHATEIATKKHIWGGTFAKRYYVPNPAVEGLVSIPTELRGAMQGKLRGMIADSLKKSGKLAGVKRAAFLPLAGDVANYAADIVRDAVATTDLTTVNLDIATLGEARVALRDKPGQADALLYGSLRDLSVVRKDTAPHEMEYTLSVELQLCIESAATREQLWSDSICVTDDFSRDTTWWATVCTYVPDVRSHPWLLVVVPLAALLLVYLIWAHTRVR